MFILHPAALNRRATLVPSPHPCRTRPPAQRVRASTHIAEMPPFCSAPISPRNFCPSGEGSRPTGSYESIVSIPVGIARRMNPPNIGTVNAVSP
jgi:hypothetical protein